MIQCDYLYVCSNKYLCSYLKGKFYIKLYLFLNLTFFLFQKGCQLHFTNNVEIFPMFLYPWLICTLIVLSIISKIICYSLNLHFVCTYIYICIHTCIHFPFIKTEKIRKSVGRMKVKNPAKGEEWYRHTFFICFGFAPFSAMFILL